MEIPQIIIDTFSKGFRIGEQLEAEYNNALKYVDEAQDNLDHTSKRLDAHRERVKEFEVFMKENGYCYYGESHGWKKKQ